VINQKKLPNLFLRTLRRAGSISPSLQSSILLRFPPPFVGNLHLRLIPASSSPEPKQFYRNFITFSETDSS
ncbi:predicted protein, partial [Arabidopsis lyrata subsp. lyrata]